MQKRSASNLVIFLAVAMAALVALGVTRLNDIGAVLNPKAAEKPVPPAAIWAAAAPGRVEPRNGEARISAQAGGRIVEVLAKLNDEVQAGDLLVRLDDEEAVARVAALEAEVAARKRERDTEQARGQALERRQAEDAVAVAERAIPVARNELDQALRAQRNGRGAPGGVGTARLAYQTARDRLETERQALRKLQSSAGMPLPTRLEVQLAAGRAELHLAEIMLERTRIRAPFEGSVMQLAARLGETVAPSPEQVLVTIGDLRQLRVRAEVEERDAPKLKAGQRVTVKTEALPGQEVEGVIATLAQSLGPPRLSQRGPRRPTDVDVLEVLVNITPGSVRLLPGMRVDVYFHPDSAAAAAPTR